MKPSSPQAIPQLESLIGTVRDQRVILAADLADIYGVSTKIYGVSTKALNQAVRRNVGKFPADFMFQLTRREAEVIQLSRSQFVTLKRGQNIKYLPYAFTGHGAIMAANVLNSRRATQMSVFVVRAFVKLRSTLMDSLELARKLAAVEAELKSRLDIHEAAIVEVLQRIMRILAPPSPPPEPAKPEIGFHVKEDASPYRFKRKWVRAGVPSGGTA